MTYDDMVAIALELPDVAEGMSYGTPALKRGKRLMLRLKEDGESVAVKLDWDTRDRLLAERPDLYFITPHYEGYPMVLARFELLNEGQVRELLQASWLAGPDKR